MVWLYWVRTGGTVATTCPFCLIEACGPDAADISFTFDLTFFFAYSLHFSIMFKPRLLCLYHPFEIIFL